MQRDRFSVFDHFSGGSDLLASHRFRSCICAFLFEGGGVPTDTEIFSLQLNLQCLPLGLHQLHIEERVRFCFWFFFIFCFNFGQSASIISS